MKDNTNLLKRLCLMQRQLGNLSGSIMFIVRDADGYADPVLEKGYLNYIKGDLSDLLKQCKILTADLNFKLSEIEKLGNKRYNEAKREFLKKNKIDKWI